MMRTKHRLSVDCLLEDFLQGERNERSLKTENGRTRKYLARQILPGFSCLAIPINEICSYLDVRLNGFPTANSPCSISLRTSFILL
jgi:hypothetical protein